MKIKISEKNIFFLMVALVFIISMFIYSFTIKGTIELRSENKQINKELLSLSNAPAQITKLENDLASVNMLISSGSTEEIRTNLLERISVLCKEEKLVLSDFQQGHVFSKGDIVVTTIPVVVEGAFKNLVKSLFKLEQDKHIGNIVAVEFNKQRNKNTKREELFLTLYIQNFTKK